MGILDVNGRPRSVRTEDEELRLLLQDIERLPEAEKIALKEVYAKLLEGDSEPYSGLANAEYRVAPVDIKTFLSDPYFLGETGASLWPRLADDIVELFEGEYEEATLGGSLGWGKCVTADTEVYDISSGARRRVDELGTFKTASMDARGLVSAESATAVKSGRKECVRFTLKDGRAVSMSLDHQVFTGRGWVEAGKLTANDLVAVPREMPGSDAFHEVTDAEVKLVAYLASDGGLAGSGVTFTNAQPSVLREVADCVEEVGDASRSTWGQVGTSDLGRRGKAKNIGLKGIRWFAADKRLPAWTYGLPKRQVALLLNRFWSCDGSVYPKKPQKAEVTLASERLIDDLQFLLSRLGVLSRKIYKASSYKDDEGKRRWFDAWRLTVTGAENILTFLHEVGDILGKEESCSALRDACSLLTPNSNTDVVPVTNDVLREMGRESGIKGLTSAYGVSGHWMGRMRFKRLCQETGYSGEKAWLAESDVAWEGVKSIENIGEQDVYDLSVENTHNFVGNGIVLHNSFFSTTAMAYTIYQMSCLKNPQRAYGIDIGSHIYVAMISVTEKVAKRVVINELIGKIRHSRYFQENFKPKEAPSQLEVRFPTNIQVVAGSTGSSAMIGLNVFSGLIDECVAGWTRVLTPDGYKTIEELYNGDDTITPIMAYSEKDGCVVRASGRIKRATNTKTFDVVLSNGAVITATSEHPFLVKGHGYVPLERLHVGDEVVVVDAEEIQQAKLRGGGESVSRQEALRGIEEEDLEIQGWCETSAKVRGDEKEDCSCQYTNESNEAGDRCQWGARRRVARACDCGTGKAQSIEGTGAIRWGMDGREASGSERTAEGYVGGTRIQGEDERSSSSSAAHTGIQGRLGREESDARLQSHRGNQEEVERGDGQEVGEVVVQVSWVGRYEKGWPVWLSLAVGEDCHRDIGFRRECRELRVRALRCSVCQGRQPTMDTAGFLGQDDGRDNGDDRGQAERVFQVEGEQVEIRGLSNLLREKGVDLRGLGRGSDLARVVSIRASGNHPTFDVMSVPHGNFIAEGAVVHNTSFLGESKKLDRHGREVVVDMGEQIYKSIIRRMKSRFQRVGRLPGVLILASSKERPSAFIEKRVHQAREVDDPMVFVREYATWDVHPAEKFSGKFFKVVVGTERISSRILSDDPEEEQRYQDLGLQIVNVPEDYRADFVSDIDGCLTGDTEIALLDGSSVPIRDLVGRDEFWTYSYGEDGRLYPGRGYDARLTHKQAEIISVLLDNGESVRCTANHLFMLRDGTYRCAGELVPGDSLMPLYRKLCKHGYEMVKSNVGGRWVHTHRIVAREALLGGCYPPEGHVIHHKDRRSKNNDPTNLEIMTEEDHRREHIKDLHRTMHSPEAKAKSAESRRKSPRCAVQRLVALEKAREVYVGSDEHRRTASKIGKRHGWGSDNENIAKARSGNGTRNITKLNRSDRNPSKKPENRRKSSERLKKMSPEKRAEVTYRGLHARWHTGDFEKCEKCMEGLAKRLCDPNNHKVVSVTQAGKEDVYDLSVDGHHNFALTAGVVVHNSLRDIAGVATDVVSQYMNRTEKVYDCQDVTLRHPVGHGDSDGPMEEWVANTPLPIQWHLIARPFKRRLPGGYEEDAWRPIRHPDAIRFAHIDTSYAGDSSGICIAHVAGWTEVVRRDSYGEEYNELAPRIETDLVLGVVPPPGDEIMLADLRGIVYQFMSHGFNVGYASLDSFQSIDTIQQLRKHGVEAEVVSIDKTTEPYDTLKTAMYEDRFRMSPHSVALREFRYLQRIPKNNGRVKIDHPKKNPDGTVGSKDVADSVAGVVYALSKKVPGMPMGIMVGTRETFDEKQDDSWVTGGRVLVQSTMSKGERQSTVDDHGGGVGVTSSLPFLKG